MNYNSFFLFLCLLSLCLCEINEVKKSKLLSDFIKYYNLRPNVDHKASDGFQESINEIVQEVQAHTHMGVRHLDINDLSSKHSLNSVIDVEIPVQVRHGERYVPDGKTGKNRNDPIYRQLAKESLNKYVVETGNQQPLSVVRIENVTTKVVSGILTTIHFKAAQNTNTNDGVYDCFSKIWEKPWVNKKEIDVSCMNPNQRSKRQVPGGEMEKNPNDPLYRQLAEESFNKYVVETGNQQPLSVVRIEKVTIQTVAGRLTTIHFKAAQNTNTNDGAYDCVSKIWEQSWANKKEISVSCVDSQIQKGMNI